MQQDFDGGAGGELAFSFSVNRIYMVVYGSLGINNRTVLDYC